MLEDLEEVKKIEELYRKDQIAILKSCPFYGLILSLLSLEVTDYSFKHIASVTKDTIRLNGGRRFGNVPYYERPTLQRQQILKHEACHLILHHFDIPLNFDIDIANLAMDSVIHRIFLSDPTIDFGSMPPGVVTPIKYGFKEGIEVGVYPNSEFFEVLNFDKKDWKEIYYDLVKQIEKSKHSIKYLKELNPLSNDVQGVAGLNQSDKNQLIKKINEIYQNNKQFGTVPKEVETFLSSYEKNLVDWKHVLQSLIEQELNYDDFSYEMNYRTFNLGYCLPKIRSSDIKDVWFVMDTSGSMSEDTISQGLSELRSMRSVRKFNLHFLTADCKVQNMISYEKDEEINWDKVPIKGRGGTSFKPAFKTIDDWCDETCSKPSIVIYFTDTKGIFPKEKPDYQVIWVTTSDDGEVPWGMLLIAK